MLEYLRSIPRRYYVVAAFAVLPLVASFLWTHGLGDRLIGERVAAVSITPGVPFRLALSATQPGRKRSVWVHYIDAKPTHWIAQGYFDLGTSTGRKTHVPIDDFDSNNASFHERGRCQSIIGDGDTTCIASIEQSYGPPTREEADIQAFDIPETSPGETVEVSGLVSLELGDGLDKLELVVREASF